MIPPLPSSASSSSCSSSSSEDAPPARRRSATAEGIIATAGRLGQRRPWSDSSASEGTPPDAAGDSDGSRRSTQGRSPQPLPGLSPTGSPVRRNSGYDDSDQRSPRGRAGETDDDEDDESDDYAAEDAGDRRLARAARRIRAELRMAEILELAAAAEAAAAAGVERFAGHPSLFATHGSGSSMTTSRDEDEGAGRGASQDDTENADGADTTPPRRPFLALRAKRFDPDAGSPGRSRPAAAMLSNIHALRERQQRRRRVRDSSHHQKIAVMALRPAEDVFPVFGSFHDHIRTHLARNRVDAQTLVYNPQPRALAERNRSLSGGPPRAKHRIVYDGLDALSQSLSFDRWVPHSNRSRSPRGAADDADYVDVLADHAAAQRHENHRPGQERWLSPPTVEPLPGLTMPDAYLKDSLACAEAYKEPPPSPGLPRTPSEAVREATTSPNQALMDRVQDDGDDEEGDDDSETDTHEEGVVHTEISLLSTPPPPPPPHPHQRKAHQFTTSEPPEPAQTRSPPSSSNADAERDKPDRPTNADHKPPSGPGFWTPARLRDMRGRQTEAADNLRSPEQEASGNSLLAGPPELRTVYKAAEIPTSRRDAILLPESLKSKSVGSEPLSPPIMVGFKPRPSPLAGNDRYGYTAADGASQPASHARIPTPPQSSRLPNLPELSACYIRDPTSTPQARPVLRSSKVKALPYDSSPSGQRSVASNSNSILYDSMDHSSHIEESPLNVDDDGISLSPESSVPTPGPVSDTLTENQVQLEALSVAQPEVGLRRSSSAGALLESDVPGISRKKWNPFSKRIFGQSKLGYETAMNMLSRFAQRPAALKVLRFSPGENDDFLHNYFYCSKAEQALVTEEQQPCHEATAACDMNSFFCASLFPDHDIGQLFRGNYQKSSDRPMLSLDRESRRQIKANQDSSWFNLAGERLDGVMTQLVGQPDRRESPWKVAFEAPMLKKSGQPKHPERERVSSIIDYDDVGEFYFRDETKTSDLLNDVSLSEAESKWLHGMDGGMTEDPKPATPETKPAALATPQRTRRHRLLTTDGVPLPMDGTSPKQPSARRHRILSTGPPESPPILVNPTF